ncbi:WD repeat-containing protein LWD1-like protein [Tritrichomonas foetus]|uniref:WD repeat-containing protein LWD1-like protein n=1 Tax=Tritrichomonas foetus TaxID=1144522 RepID=A0A1J4KB60_9EUKA|nr:WD repeat-containing protein LWD1-like protein [Tritrichomonas foetus]|eukprot:OHT08459.1 WD repeat-containing protein LWD1-like protein [Tritrichomonas foetus]
MNQAFIQNAVPTTKIMITHSCIMPFEPFRIAWSSPFSAETRLAVGSFEKSNVNFMKIIKFVGPSAINESEIRLPYPVCNIKFCPHGINDNSDRMITCGDNLKLWQISTDSVQLVSDVQTSPKKIPLTSFDWSIFQENLVLVGGTDGAATAVDVGTGQIAARIIAHDHPIHDISFCGTSPTFLTASFDGSLRFFDLRDLQSSFIYYQTAMPLMRIEVSPYDSNLIAMFSRDSQAVTVVDTRHPGVPVNTCEAGDSPITCIGWSKLQPNLLFWSTRDCCLCNATLGEAMAPQANVLQRTSAPIECFANGHSVLAETLANRVDIIKYISPDFSQNLHIPISMLLE